MTNLTNNQQGSRLMLVLLVVFLTGISSCNNAANTDDKKTDSTAGTGAMMTDSGKINSGTDTLKPATIDTGGRDTKVPHQ